MIDCLSVVGTRPQLIKLKPIWIAFKKSGLNHNYIDTGQHYSQELSGDIVNDLSLERPLLNLEVGSGSHAYQTAKIMMLAEDALRAIKPRSVLIYGDTNSTLAAALVTSKLNIPLFHAEAGLRSYDFSIPEEINRIAADHISSLLFAPTRIAFQNLEKENLENRTRFTGDLMYDLVRQYLEQNTLSKFDLKNEHFGICTIHRPRNTDDPERLKSIINSLGKIDMRIYLFAHPRLMNQFAALNLEIPANLKVMKPIPHSELIKYLSFSEFVITDSGGMQKEAYFLRVPCTTLKHETEWVETLAEGWNKLIDDPELIHAKFNQIRPNSHNAYFGDGNASTKIVEEIANYTN